MPLYKPNNQDEKYLIGLIIFVQEVVKIKKIINVCTVLIKTKVIFDEKIVNTYNYFMDIISVNSRNVT